MALIAIDMTPLRPGGENGGVKLMALELVKGFQTASPRNSYLIITASWNDQELAALDGPHTTRLCLSGNGEGAPTAQEAPVQPGATVFRRVYESLPRPVRNGLLGLGIGRVAGPLLRTYGLLTKRRTEPSRRGGPLTERGVDVLFCPFTAPHPGRAGHPGRVRRLRPPAPGLPTVL
jgi:hypothetical protein